MECPRCKSRIKRLRTKDQGNMVTRYNGCPRCGERFKTVELYLVEYDRERTETIERMVSAESEARQLTLNLNTIRTAFKDLHDAIRPLQESQDRAEPLTSFPGRYTRDYRLRRGF